MEAGSSHVATGRPFAFRYFRRVDEARMFNGEMTAFPDQGDARMFPLVSDEKFEKLSRFGKRIRFEAGELLYDQGQRNTPFFVIDFGRIRVIDRRPNSDELVATVEARTFLGEISTFTGAPALAACVAAGPTEVLRFEREEFRELLLKWPEFAEWVLDTFEYRRHWHEQTGHGMIRLFASRNSRDAFEVRDLLDRNLMPVQWHDPGADGEASRLLESVGLDSDEVPVLVFSDKSMRDPTVAKLADKLELRADVHDQTFDLVVLGAGPAGLAAAVYGGSEGLRTLVVESWGPGGQAGTSNRIENYLGFPAGISGRELSRRATHQAQRFNATISSYHRSVGLEPIADGMSRISFDDGQEASARAVIVSTGARWRSHPAEGLARLNGTGVYYIAMPADIERCRGEDVVIIGGGNSAGQAAVQMSRAARSVRMVIRGKGLSKTMSSYLIDRIELAPNIEVHTESEIVRVNGRNYAESIDIRGPEGSETNYPVSAVFVMIGADPCTEGIGSQLAVDEAGYVLCGPAISKLGDKCGWCVSRDPGLLETALPGVFVAGDVRAGASKRVAGAVGDGALAVRLVHEYLAGQDPLSVPSQGPIAGDVLAVGSGASPSPGASTSST